MFKQCDSHRLWYQENREKILARQREYYRANREQIITRTSAYAKRKRALTPRKARQKQWPDWRARHLQQRYGLTPGEFAAMVAAQNNVCAICGRLERKRGRGGKTRPLAVDHCHVTGKVRGLLCDACNNGIARFNEKPEYLEAAVRYLNHSTGASTIA